MNYRHHFHAGNFADLLKHAVLLDQIETAQADMGPLEVVETHAGAGAYALDGPEARRSGEAQAGIVRLLGANDAPPGLCRLSERVKRFQGEDRLPRYPGSPLLAIGALRAGDGYLGFELRPDDQASLSAAIRAYPRAPAVAAQSRLADGFRAAVALPPPKGARIVLIDPPFERGDEAARIVEASATLRRTPRTTVAVWAPLKDLDALDRLRSGLMNGSGVGWMVETRLRPLHDPLRMNGCAMIVLGSRGGSDSAYEAAAWIAATLGDGRGVARCDRWC